MELMDLNKLGAHVSGNDVQFGFLLPQVSDSNGNELWVKIIHEKVQMIQGIEPRPFKMTHSVDPKYGDYWSTTVKVAPDSGTAKDWWGKDGKYVYRFELRTPTKTIDYISDAFAYSAGLANLAAFRLGVQDYVWSANETKWKTPSVNDLIIYESMIPEFGRTIEGVTEKINYLNDLEINCVEFTPVFHAPEIVGWRYCTQIYTTVDDLFGESEDFKKLVDTAHQNGIAVILDIAFGHAGEEFPYWQVYEQLGYDFYHNPFFGPFAGSCIACKDTDFSKKFTQDFFFTVVYHWLADYHADGLRIDCVPSIYDGPMGQGYANLVYSIYQLIKSKQGSADHWQRFFNNGEINIVLCSENLDQPVEMLEKTYTNCAWQGGTLYSAVNAASAWKSKEPETEFRRNIEEFGKNLGLLGYPVEKTYGSDTIKKTAIQYLGTHDQPHFICTLSEGSECSLGDCDRKESGSRNAYKVQPYLIGLLTAKGIPMIWQGMEFAANYDMPSGGPGRTGKYRPVNFSYFYTTIGKNFMNLTRKLTKIRRSLSQFRQGDHYFYNTPEDQAKYLNKKVVVFKRSLGNKYSVVALNFSDSEVEVPFKDFPKSGYYKEELDGINDLPNVIAGQEYNLKIPSNYAGIWNLQ